jgi:hypothetical protein
LQGEFFSISNHQEAPFTPNPLPSVNDTGKMMYVWLTEYMADTAGFVYQQAGQLNYNVTPSMVSTKITKRGSHFPIIYSRSDCISAKFSWEGSF